MNIYEKENAKEWQLDTSNKQKTGPASDESDSDVENSNAAPPAGLSQNRFAPIAAAPLNPRTDRGSVNRSPKRAPRANIKPVNQTSKAPPPTRPTTHRPAKPTTTLPTKELHRGTPRHTNTSQRLPANPAAHTSLTNRTEPVNPQATSKITFTTKKDNASKAAFRKGKAPDETFALPTICEKIEPNRSKMYARLEEIGVRFNSFVRPPQSLKDRILLIWGDEKHVAETISELKHWAALADKDAPGALETILTKPSRNKFSRTGELVERQERLLDQRLKLAAEMQAYQKEPIDGQRFEFQGYFLWPADEVKPEDLLGSNCEAFDPIRTYNRSHIVWEPHLSCFKILSNSEPAVQNAIERIEGTMREYAARSSTTYAFNVAHFPKGSSMREEVKALPGPPLSNSHKSSMIPVLTGRALVGDTLMTFTKERRELMASNKQQIQKALSKIIERLPRFRGRLRMRVHFGTFTLDTIRWPGGAPTIPYTEFKASITNTATTTGAVVRDLQYEQAPEMLVGRCTSSKGAFAPMYIAHDGDSAIIPTYTARFKFRSRETGVVTLEVELNKRLDEHSIYEVSRTQWTRNDHVATNSPFDVNVVQLTGGCSWNLQVSHDTNLDETRITPRMADFASSIGYKAPPSEVRPEITGAKVFKHAFNLQYETFEQKTALRFQHKDHSAWIFEFARYDTFSPNVSTASEVTQWGASLWNTEWDTILAENDNLGIGQGAKWDAKFGKFFPGDSQTEGGVDGFQEFLHKVQDVTHMLDEMKGIAQH